MLLLIPHPVRAEDATPQALKTNSEIKEWVGKTVSCQGTLKIGKGFPAIASKDHKITALLIGTIKDYESRTNDGKEIRVEGKVVFVPADTEKGPPKQTYTNGVYAIDVTKVEFIALKKQD